HVHRDGVGCPVGVGAGVVADVHRRRPHRLLHLIDSRGETSPVGSPAMDPDQARRRLEEERARLEGVRETFADEHLNDESESDNVSELSSIDQHQADLGTETFEREKDISILEQIEAELADVEHALHRLDDGTYGTCEVDGKPI